MKNRPYIFLGLICLVALLLRMGLLLLVNNPGLPDAIHYYNLGTRLLDGQGFTIDYIWQYSHLPQSIVNPISHWMPLPGVVAAAGMAIGGLNIHAALIFFVLAGALLPIPVFFAGRQIGLSDAGALFGAAFAIALPDMVWNSLRTDTTILNMLLLTTAIVLVTRGIQRGGWWQFVLAGILGGLSYLNRNDSILILPTIYGALLLYAVFGGAEFRRRVLPAGGLVTLAMLLTMAPWIARNLELFGRWGSAETSYMFFMVDQRDHYSYGREISLENMLAQRTPQELIGKRLFELVAAGKQIIISLDIVLPVLIPLGLLLLWNGRKREHLLALSPALIWLMGILVAYPLLIPYKSQSGSFEKAYLTIVPLLLPLGALAVERLIVDRRWQLGLVGLAVVVMSLNSYDVLRAETSFADRYYATIGGLVAEVDMLPDVTGDGEIQLMVQDPYIMSYYGIRSIMIPLASREDTLELASRYEIDYVLFPAARPQLDPLYHGAEVDPRFVFTLSVPMPDGRFFELYALHPEIPPESTDE
ncbi:MAG: glycosyltransferase family 39 protein [Anaerolineae bacterium]|nr:glycosyltransferase family 39 protein [Anaerolineae bacterium]